MTTKIFNREILFNNLDMLRKSKHLLKRDFNKALKISNAYRTDYDSIGAQLLKGIQDNFPGIDEDWLLTSHDVKIELPLLIKKYGATIETQTGQGEMLINKTDAQYSEQSSETPSNNPNNSNQAAYHANTPAQPSFDDYMDHTSDVLRSPSIFSTALKSNIEAFYFGLRINKDLDAAHNLLRQHAQLFQAQNQTINNLKNKIDNLAAENINLKNNNDNQEERIKAIEERLLALKSA